MKKSNKKTKSAFTLVELLAVIVILAIILIIAIPQIMSTIKTSRLSAIKDSALLLATNAEKDYITQLTLDQYYNVSSIECSEVVKLNDDYDIDNCSVTYNEGVATVTLKGKNGGKFSGITCTGTKDNMCCSIEGEEGECEAGGSDATNIATCVIEGCNKTAKETELVIGGENFYVVSSDATKTVLLAKYDLKSDGNGSYTQDTSGTNTNASKSLFASEGYWDGCKYKKVSESWECSSSPSGLINPYNANNAAYCTSTSGTNCAYVYDDNSKIYVLVNKYAEKVSNASGTSMTGALLTLEQANSLSSEVRKDLNRNNYWLGSAYNHYILWLASWNGNISRASIVNLAYNVRPVLVVSTSAL